MALYEKPLSMEIVGRIIKNVCQWEIGRKILKEMTQILKNKKVLLVVCNKDYCGLKKQLHSNKLLTKIQ